MEAPVMRTDFGVEGMGMGAAGLSGQIPEGLSIRNKIHTKVKLAWNIYYILS